MKSYKNSYNAAQKMAYEPCECDPGRCAPPAWVLDKIAEEKLLGGFKLRTGRGRNRKSNVCQRCFVTKSANGSCNCS